MPAIPTLVWNGIYGSPAFASIQAPSPYELDIGGTSGTSPLIKVVRNQSSAYVAFGGSLGVSFNCGAPVYSASGFSGSGAGLTSLNGAAITPGSVNFSAFEAATAAQLADASALTTGTLDPARLPSNFTLRTDWAGRPLQLTNVTINEAGWASISMPSRYELDFADSMKVVKNQVTSYIQFTAPLGVQFLCGNDIPVYSATGFSGDFFGGFDGDGGNITNLNASALSSGTIPLDVMPEPLKSMVSGGGGMQLGSGQALFSWPVMIDTGLGPNVQLGVDPNGSGWFANGAIHSTGMARHPSRAAR